MSDIIGFICSAISLGLYLSWRLLLEWPTAYSALLTNKPKTLPRKSKSNV